jgi:hypothetical protein
MRINTRITMERIPEASPRLKARMAGLFELLEALTSGSGQVLVPGTIVVSGNAAATAANVLAHELLFRLGLAAAVIAVACHIAWTLLFYQLFARSASSVRLNENRYVECRLSFRIAWLQPKVAGLQQFGCRTFEKFKPLCAQLGCRKPIPH